jgi:hypothetical protein
MQEKISPRMARIYTDKRKQEDCSSSPFVGMNLAENFMTRRLTALSLILLLSACGKRRAACIYEIPEGFSGWVLIVFEQTNSPPLPTRDGKLVFRICDHGQLSTSSTLQYGWAKDEYYFVGNNRRPILWTARGKGGLIWGESTGSSQTRGVHEQTYENFFVGTEEQLRKAGEPPRP